MKTQINTVAFIFAISILSSCTKIPNIKTENSGPLTIFPNPCINECNIILNNITSNDYTIKVYNTNGKQIKKIDNISSVSSNYIDLKNETDGVFRAVASNGTNTYVASFLKTKLP